MKTTNILRGVAALAVLVSLCAGGCKKKDKDPEPVQDTEQGTATDNNFAESVAADIESIAGQAVESGNLETFRTSGSEELLSACATVSVDTSTKVVTVDFGSGCPGGDGRTRSGKLLINYSSSATNARYYRNPGFRVDITSQNYVVDGHQVNIVNKTVQNTTPLTIGSGTNPGTNLTWSVSATITITKPNNGGSISWSCTRTKELVNTSDPNCYRGQSQHIIWSKAIVKLNGSASGTNARNESFTSTATDLLRDFGCSPYAQHPHRHPFISGTLAYKPASRPVRIVDFGSGTCDQSATVTINNVVYSINLP